MFDTLSERLQSTLRRLRGEGRFTEENISDALRDVRRALLEADVALPVVKQFVDRVRAQAVGQDVLQSLSPAQSVIKFVHDALVEAMGVRNDALDLNVRPPAVILLAGLQGSGKTTTAAKLARFLIERHGKKVLLASVDIYRPAAMDQLAKLARDVGASCLSVAPGQAPVDIARAALDEARKQVQDGVIVDSAGRLHVDEQMMTEIRAIHAAVSPVETLFVVDAMTGQDAVKAAVAFNEALSLTGVVLTKADGDARGGAALSVRHVTGKPIKFIGMGERTDALEPFHPDRLASRILGMGDVLTLVEEAQRKVDQKQAQKLAQKLGKGKGFDLEDFRNQLLQMNQLGGLSAILDKLPGAAALSANAREQINDKQTTQIVAIIDSMTPHERRYPDIVRGSRKVRISNGSGTQVQEVNRLLKQFAQMQKMMKRVGKKGGIKNLARALKGVSGTPF
ncbi:MAG: signal recognition particle protein [Acidiferrobacteraceae bacterium]